MIVMSIKNKLRKIKNNPIGLYVWNEYRRILGKRSIKKYSDLEFIDKLYLQTTGHKVNWNNPQRLTEKMQWLKLFYRNSLMPICSDKYTVRSYLIERGYENLLNEIHGVYDDPKDINLNKLPDKFVLKGTAGSGWNLICHDKNAINWYWWKKIMHSWLKQDLYIYGREWNYKQLNGKILVEEYLEDDSGELRDYKLFCFNGNPQFMQVDESRFSDHKRVYVKESGEVIKVQDGVHGLDTFKMDKIHHELFKIARDLSRDFPFVRVDFYICNNKIYFGELTFFDGSGFYNLDPDDIDYEWGRYLDLPKANANLDLLDTIGKL